MIGKPITGKSFGGCVRYIVDKQQATILSAEGVRMQNAESIIKDFNLQRSMRPGLGKAVGHIVLSWSKEDLPKLSDLVMAERAKEYMQRMMIPDTQYIVVRHSDRQHPHIHIIYNRVDNNGRTISDRNNYQRNMKACKEMTLKYGYHLGQGKDRVNRQALRGKEKLRYELYDAIRSAVKQSTNWKTLEANLQKQGIAIQYKSNSRTSEVQGVWFEKENIKLKGSAIDRAFSYHNLHERLKRNHFFQQQHIIQEPAKRSFLEEHLEERERRKSHEGENMLEVLLKPSFAHTEPDPAGDAEKRRRKRKRQEQHYEHTHGINR